MIGFRVEELIGLRVEGFGSTCFQERSRACRVRSRVLASGITSGIMSIITSRVTSLQEEQILRVGFVF